MKKILTIALALPLFAFVHTAEAQILSPIFGQTDKAVLTLNDGTVIEGYNRLTLDFGAVVGISETTNGSFKTYYSKDIKSLDLYPRTGDAIHYETTLATRFNSAFAGGRVSIHSIPLILQVVFEGENVTGYVLDMDTNDEENTYKRTYYYYYKVKDAEFAEIYWEKDSNMLLQSGPGMKKQLKKEFSAWPEVVNWIDSKEYKPKAFTKNPLIVLEILDTVLDKAASAGK